MKLTRAALATLGVGAALGAAVYGALRAAVKQWRGRPDPDVDDTFSPVFDEARSIPSRDGGLLYTISRGAGAPIVFSHGVTLSVRAWTKQFESIPKEGFQVVAFDHRGHGESHAGEAGHSIDNLAADVASVVEAHDLHGAVLVGHSMGGIAVQAFATRFPDVAARRVAGIVLLSTFARSTVLTSAWLLRLAELVVERGPGGATLFRRPDLGFAMARIGFGVDPLPSHIEFARQMLLACGDDTTRAAVHPLLSVDLSDAIQTIALPTLIVCGTRDVLSPPGESKRMAGLIPGARLELLDGIGHMAMLECPDVLDRLIIDFAREVGGASG